MGNYIISALLILVFGGLAIWYGVGFTPVTGTCLQYDRVRGNIANRGLFQYELVQNVKTVQYQSLGIRLGFGLKVGDQYRLLVSKKDPSKITGYDNFVIFTILGLSGLLDLIIYALVMSV